MHVVIAGERSDGRVGANAAVLEAQSAKTTLFFMSGFSLDRARCGHFLKSWKERIWPLYFKKFRNIFQLDSSRGTAATLKRLDYRTIPDGRRRKGRGERVLGTDWYSGSAV